MRTRRLCNAFFLPLLLTLLASCSGAGSSLDVASFVTGASSSKWRADEAQTSLLYRPDPDGFSFGNYQMTDPASFTIDDAAALLKDAVCTKDVSGCVPSASAVEWVETVRAALQGGLCEGFSLLSMSSYLSQEAATASVFSLSKSKETEERKSGNSKTETSWYHQLTHNPVLILGADISTSEWDIWFALVNRERNFAKGSTMDFKYPIFQMRECESNNKVQSSWFKPLFTGLKFDRQWSELEKLLTKNQI